MLQLLVVAERRGVLTMEGLIGLRLDVAPQVEISEEQRVEGLPD